MDSRSLATNIEAGGEPLPDLNPQSADATDALLSDREVASFLGIGRSTVWHWVSEGVLPSPLKLGGLSRWRQSAIQDVITKAEAEAQAA